MCMRAVKIVLLVLLYGLNGCSSTSQPIILCKQNVSNYSIIIKDKANSIEQKAAIILQTYFKKVTTIQLPIKKESDADGRFNIYVGYTNKSKRLLPYMKIRGDDFILATQSNQVFIYAATDKALLYATYEWIERYLKCRKLGAGPAYCPSLSTITMEGDMMDIQMPAFEYREVYYPYEEDEEYMWWHKIHTINKDWGLWGHTFNKIIAAKQYFTTHPEYFSLINGKRKPVGLCLTNASLKKEFISILKEKMENNPSATYWSVSPEEGIEYCTCNACNSVVKKKGTTALLLYFINTIATAFPDKKIVTLAYEQTSEPPENISIRNNVYIMLSDIEVYRHQPLSTSKSAAIFRKRLEGWRAITSNIFIWDYVTQFTNYLAPFPNIQTLQPNIQFLQSYIKGIFEQGSGETVSENSALRSYLLAKWLWNPSLNRDSLQQDFLQHYYGKAAPCINQYVSMLEDALMKTKATLDIYGNPIDAKNTFLSPTYIDTYSQVLDKAEALAEGNDYAVKHITEARIPLEYTVLQQARYYGLDLYGIFEKEGDTYKVKPTIHSRLKRLVNQCNDFGITTLSEIAFTANDYLKEWEEIIYKAYKVNKALNATVSLQYAPNPEYFNKGPRTIVDGMYGFSDYSYNWLCFYNVNMEAVITLPRMETVETIECNFLDDPKHYIFLPTNIDVFYSVDGKKYQLLKSVSVRQLEHYNPIITPYIFSFPTVSAKYIKLVAKNNTALPNWRQHDTKKPMLACDEVYVK